MRGMYIGLDGMNGGGLEWIEVELMCMCMCTDIGY